MTNERYVLMLSGLACGGGGATTIERSLRRVVGVRSARVDPLTERAFVEVDPSVTGPSRLVAAVERVGYGVVDSARLEPAGPVHATPR